MKAECIFNITGRDQAAAAVKAGVFRTPSLEAEGFIHFSRAHQVLKVAARFYAGLKDQVILVVDPSLLRSELRFEPPSPAPDRIAAPGFEADSMFPHLYGELNADAIVDVVDLESFDGKPIHPDTQAILRRYRFGRLPVEGTLYKSSWQSAEEHSDLSAGIRPMGTAMIGLYTDSPRSVSCFHRLDTDEVWHFYNGDPLTLHLLHPDGRAQSVSMGADSASGQLAQFTVPAGVWQAGEMSEGGRYSLFGCTMAPGFIPACFEAANSGKLKAKYPGEAATIMRLSAKPGEIRMPDLSPPPNQA